jgi:hypothetical protein
MFYEFLSNLLSDKKGDVIFSCFSIWHFLYLILFVGATILTIALLKNKPQEVKSKAVNTAISIAFGLYMADFFLMPFAYGEIDIDKLPFHACTSMCIMSFASRHSKFLSKFTLQFALIGLISNLIYVVYPDGVAAHEIHPLSYRAVQTLTFHGVMVIYGILTIVLDNVKIEWKKCYRELIVLIILACWALLGNTLYTGTVGDYSHNFNWFFVKRDPFGMLDPSISRYIMPFITVAAFFGANLVIYAIYFGIKKAFQKKS